MRAISQSIRDAQSFGYIEWLICSKINPIYVLLCSGIYPIIKGVIRIFIYFMAIFFFTDISISISTFLAYFLIIFIALIPFIAFSILAASFIIFFKQAEPINFLINIFISVFSGIVYPVTVLPKWMQNISELIPITKNLETLRGLIINGMDNLDITFHSLYELIFIPMFMLVISFAIFNISIHKAKQKGSIGRY